MRKLNYMEKEKKKMGRPTEEPKTEQYRIRLTKTEMLELNDLSEKMKMSKADVIRVGLEKLKNTE